MQIRSKLTPCLWFDRQAEDAANFYVGIFPDSRIIATSRYAEAGREVHGQEPGSVMTVTFELAGQSFVALNGGPVFQHSPAISFQIICEDQPEVDHFWDRLTAGGDDRAQECGWLKDRFGISWQVVPRVLPELLMDSDPAKSAGAMKALLKMRKPDIARLRQAAGLNPSS